MKDLFRIAQRAVDIGLRGFLDDRRGGVARIIDGVLIAVLAAAVGKLLGLG